MKYKIAMTLDGDIGVWIVIEGWEEFWVLFVIDDNHDCWVSWGDIFRNIILKTMGKFGLRRSAEYGYGLIVLGDTILMNNLWLKVW